MSAVLNAYKYSAITSFICCLKSACANSDSDSINRARITNKLIAAVPTPTHCAM